jgi:hypothetical protein
VKLVDLSPHLIKYETINENVPLKDIQVVKGIEYKTKANSIEEAQGIIFKCPVCYNDDFYKHYIEITFNNRGVDDHQGTHNLDGSPARWDILSFDNLETISLSPVGLIDGHCGWHGSIVKGEVLE